MSTYAPLRDALRAEYYSRRNHIQDAEKGQFKRPPTWFVEQNHRLRDVEAVGRLLSIIVDNEASFEAWLSGVKPVETRGAA